MVLNRVSFLKPPSEILGIMPDESYSQLVETERREGAFEESAPGIRWPEIGGIKALLEVGLVYHLVSIAMPVLIGQIELLNPTIVPEPFTTVLYVLLGLGIGTAIAWLFVSESFFSTRRFDEYDDVGEFLERGNPDRHWFLSNGGLTVFGGLLTWLTYGRFRTVFLEVVDLLVIVVDEFEWMITLSDGVYVAGFLGGFSLFAVGVDRLVVGGLRRYVQRRHDPD